MRLKFRGLGALLAACLLLLLSASYLFWQASQRQESLVSTVRENLLWAAMQLERETQQWRLFQKEATLQGEYDIDELELRFELLYSRFVTLNHGEMKAAIDQYPQLSDRLTSVGHLLNSLDQKVQRYLEQPSGDFSVFNEQTSELNALTNDFINHVISTRSESLTSNRNELLTNMFWLSVSIVLFITSTVLLIYLLVRSLAKEQRQVTALSDMASKLSETAEQAKAASNAKSAFLAMMSHEIRTPLSGILGMLDILSAEPLPDKVRGYATAARDSADHLRVVVNDILDMSSIEVGRLEIINEPMSLLSLLEDMKTLANAEIDSKPITFHLDLAADLPNWIEGDRVRLRQVMLNLINNASKFTNRGKIVLSATWSKARTSTTEGRLRIEVRDTGIGIDPDQQALLFQEFTQLDNTTRRRFGGTGLGLSISKKLVALMGGVIDVSSKKGEGACFWFELPTRRMDTLVSADAPSIGYCDFDANEGAQVDMAAQVMGAVSHALSPHSEIPANVRAILINWRAPYEPILDAMARWQDASTNPIKMIAVVPPDQASSAYPFIKAGGQSLLIAPMTPDKLAERLVGIDKTA